MYLVAVMDWWSRYVVAWELSNSLDSEFCIRAWDEGLAGGRTPLISNTDQGSQFTSEAYLDAVESAGVDVSMDGRGRWIDNRFIERLWRSVKQEDIYLQDYSDGLTAQRGLNRWFEDYNMLRPHQALGYATPGERFTTTQQPMAPSRLPGPGSEHRGTHVVQPFGRPSGAPSGLDNAPSIECDQQERRATRQRKQEPSRPRNANLFSAFRGPRIGVHPILPSKKQPEKS
jgi:hypothetical protein